MTLRRRKALQIAGALAVLCLFTATPAHAIVAQPIKTKARPETKAGIRKAPKPPKRDQVHRGGVDGTLTLIQFVSNRRHHDDKHSDQDLPLGSVAQVRASSEHADPGSSGSLTARAVQSLPPHWASTHLTI